MKKGFIFALSAISIFSLAACGGNKPAEESSSASEERKVEEYIEKGTEHTKPYSITNNLGEKAESELVVQWQNAVDSLDQRVQITTADDTDFKYAHNVDATDQWVLDNEYLMSKKLGNYATRGLYKATIKDLEPGTDYIYRIGASGAWSDTYYHTTAEGDGSNFSFTLFSDPQAGTHEAMTATLNKSLEYDPETRFFLCNGDITDDQGNKVNEIQDYADTAVTFNKYRPIAVTEGNHDTYGTTKSNYLWGEATVFNSFVTAPDNGYENDHKKAESYYFYYNNVLFITMNSMIKEADYSRQAEWLTGILEENKTSGRGEYIIINSHMGPIGNQEGDKNREKAIRNTYLSIFNEYKVDCYFYGHDHSYARTNPICLTKDDDLMTFDTTPDYDNGVVYSIVGTAGPKFDGEDKRVYQENMFTVRTTQKSEVDPGMFVNVRVTDSQLEITAAKADSSMTELDYYTVPKKSR